MRSTWFEGCFCPRVLRASLAMNTSLTIVNTLTNFRSSPSPSPKEAPHRPCPPEGHTSKDRGGSGKECQQSARNVEGSAHKCKRVGWMPTQTHARLRARGANTRTHARSQKRRRADRLDSDDHRNGASGGGGDTAAEESARWGVAWDRLYVREDDLQQEVAHTHAPNESFPYFATPSTHYNTHELAAMNMDQGGRERVCVRQVQPEHVIRAHRYGREDVPLSSIDESSLKLR